MGNSLKIRFTKPTASRILVWVILLIPIMKYYELPIVGLGMETFLIFISLSLCIYISFNNRGNPLDKKLKTTSRFFLLSGVWLLGVTAYYELFTNINMQSGFGGYGLNTLIVLVMTIFLIRYIFLGKIDAANMVGAYSWLVWFLVAIYIFQFLLQSAGLAMNFKIPFLSFTSGWSFLNGRNFGMLRLPTALFSERSHLSQYLIPYVALCLYSDRIIPKHRYLKAVAVSAVILSTVSGNGVIGVALIWIMYAFLFGTIKKQYRILMSIVIVGGIIVGYYLLSKVDSFNQMFSYLFTSEDTRAAKADYRIYRGLDIFSRLPAKSQMFGVGYKHMEAYAYMNGIVSIYDKTHSSYEYFASIPQLLIYSGFVGTALFSAHWISMYKNSPKFIKGFLIIEAALFFSTEILYMNDHIMYSLIIVAVYKQLVLDKEADLTTLTIQARKPKNRRYSV